MTRRRAFYLSFSILLWVLLFLYADKVKAAGRDAVQVALTVLLPVVVPNAILSRLLLASLPDSVSGRGRVWFCYLFGAFCGAPIGALMVRRLVDGEILSRRDAERLLAAVSHVSPLFCLTVPQNKQTALLVWCFGVLSGLPAVLRTKPLKETAKGTQPTMAEALTAGAFCGTNVLVSVLWFRTLGTVLAEPFESRIFEGVLYALLEISAAVSAADAMSLPYCDVILAFAVAFGGFSIALQCATVSGLSLRRYCLKKLTLGCGAALIITFLSFFG